MRLMIDTNILLDVLLEREPFFDNSKAVLQLCEDKKVYGFLSVSSVTDIFCITRKALQNTDLAYKALGCILDIVKVLSVTNEDVLSAYMRYASDQLSFSFLLFWGKGCMMFTDWTYTFVTIAE